ncbi:FimV/HubP family polar landmark protein [sulfur-oxidizing endosymbiont of Gigantopelta aegis]|uniref:FimV/HubP family polar landmark protein n=1 Tax=sulfur-oxidizing endosymbiont of Gigantopelta aegis TaxID=2794934 RepID=UPI001BE3EDEB|nr:FimV/HubP family polar landmark protein [sulfur-oxidizing endosymbiont of Gigantopelta aegis]
MTPMASWALGMGDIQVNSSLNQPLNAEIALHSVTKKDLDTLRIGLAPRNVYIRADIERSEYLRKFRFKIIQQGGKNYVQVTTKKPFREPFANFLIEASWGSGRLLREYTMLLDPPEFIRKQAQPVTTATASRSSQVRRTTKPTSSKSYTSKASNTSAYASDTSSGTGLSYGPTQRNDTLWVIAKEMAPGNVSVNQMMMALLRENPNAFIDNNINSLKSGYVLRIKNVDSISEVSRLNAKRQVQEQYQDWKNLRKQASSSNMVDRSDRSSDAAPTDGKLTLVASGDTENSDMQQGDLNSKAKQLKNKLMLTGEELESKEVENQELRARIKELEDLLKTKTSLVELKDASLAALQKQKEIQAVEAETTTTTDVEEIVTDEAVESVEQIITAIEIVSDEAKTTDDMQAAENTDADVIDANVSETKDSTGDTATDTTEAIVDADSSESSEATTDSNTQESMTPEMAMPEKESVTPAEPTPEVKPVAEVVEKVVEEKTKPVKPATAPVESDDFAPDEIVDMLLSEEMLPYTAGGGGFLVLLLAWLGLRGRGKKENEFEESILDSKMTGDESDFGLDDSELVEANKPEKDGGLASDTETSFLSDFSADDMESLQPDDTEADPMSEADVFMVYGRYQQAEELLQGAIKSEPERVDYQMKLLEVYHGDNLKDSFAVQADVVKDLLKQSNDDYELTSEWTKAKSWAEKLGLDIDMPDFFDEDTTKSEQSPNDEESLDELTDDLSLDSEEIEFNEDSILGDVDDELSLDDLEDSSELTLDNLDDISLDEESSEFTLEENEINNDQAEDTSDDFELSLDDFDENTSDNELSEELSLEGTDEFDLNFDETTDSETSLELDETLELDTEDESLELDNSLDLEEDSLELDENSLELNEDSLELNEDSLELDGDNLELDEDSFELDDNSLELDENSLEIDDDDLILDDEATDTEELDFIAEEFDQLEGDFPELDAVGTKLDLAKAYIDMGDMESASSILNEVVDEGDDEQKAQAKSLLDQADS